MFFKYILVYLVFIRVLCTPAISVAIFHIIFHKFPAPGDQKNTTQKIDHPAQQATLFLRVLACAP